MKTELYFDMRKKEYYTLPTKCEYCKTKIFDKGYIFSKYSKSTRIEDKTIICCRDCLSKSAEDNCLYDYWDGKQFIVTTRIRSEWIIYYFTPPSFKNSKNSLSTWDAAEKQLGDEIITNNTSYSFKNQNPRDSISFEEAQAKLLLRDEELTSNPDDPLDLLKDLQTRGAEQIENEKKRLLN